MSTFSPGVPAKPIPPISPGLPISPGFPIFPLFPGFPYKSMMVKYCHEIDLYEDDRTPESMVASIQRIQGGMQKRVTHTPILPTVITISSACKSVHDFIHRQLVCGSHFKLFNYVSKHNDATNTEFQ